MWKALRLIVGLSVGAAIGAILAGLFAPDSGEPFAARLRRSYAEALEAAREASRQRRAHLESEVERMQRQDE